MEFITDNSPASPNNNLLENSDYKLELPEWNLDKLKQAAIQQRLLRPRSLAWAIMLSVLPPPTGDIITRRANELLCASVNSLEWLDQNEVEGADDFTEKFLVPIVSLETAHDSPWTELDIKVHRNFYNDLKSKLSMDPRTVIGDDPLSQNDESVWRQHFCDNELKTVILQDVVRTFPDELYFREKDVQDMLVRILFFWARSHSNVGYRQGMHEILAPLLFELYLDRKFAPKQICNKLKIILDEDYLEHDSHMLFNTIMKGLEKFYVTGDVVPTSSGRMPASKVIHNPNEVVRYLDKLREEHLIPLDPELAAHLADCKISMELFGIRWLRLLFGREFPRSEVPHLWGFLFSDGPMLPNLHYVIVAILISIRTTLLDRDAGVVLSALMRPVCLSVGHVCALALHLRRPLHHPRPPTPPPPPAPTHNDELHMYNKKGETAWELELRGSECGGAGGGESGSEGVAEGADVARELAALALLRARLPPAAAALARALPRAPLHVQQPLQQILHLAALLQCRNHALVDVETALEAAEGHSNDKIVGRRTMLPVAMHTPNKRKHDTNHHNKIKEVPLRVFHEVECETPSDLPCLDPLRLRTE